MPRAQRLSSRLDSLLDAVFRPVADPRALFDQIAEELSPAQLAQAQKKIRKALREEREVGADAAVITACVLHCTGFPAHRILRYLSLYVPDTVPPSLLLLAVDVIFRGKQPLSESLLYDLTQYTYLEKRLLVRKSAEISEALRPQVGPELLLFLYLQALRDDLSNENVRLIALVLRDCAPSLVLRTRAGGVSADESDEVVRAVKAVESRTLEPAAEASAGRSRKAESRPFDRQSASAFLDKYFSDEALARMREVAPPPPVRKPAAVKASPPLEREITVEIRTVGKPAPARTRTAHAPQTLPSTSAPTPETGSPSPRTRVPGGARAEVKATRRAAAPAAEPAAPRARGRAAAHPAASRQRQPAAPRAAVARAAVARAEPSSSRHAWLPAWVPIWRGTWLLIAPTLVGAAAAGALLLAVPAGPHRSPAPAAVQPAPAAVQPAPAVQPPPAPPTVTYTVKPGDSLWKIFSSRNSDRRRWEGFLSTTQSVNGLDDPNRLRPGKTLTISAGE